MRTQTHQPLADLATRQHGVVSIRQLERLGYGRSTVARAVQDGRLHHLHRGVYAVGHRQLTWHGHCLAAVLANAPAAVASHFSAAWLWGLLRTRPSGTFHITAPHRRHSRTGIVVHFARLTDEDREMVDGIPVTAAARTTLDLAARLSAAGMEHVLERCEDHGIFDLSRFERLLERAGGHPGRGRLQTALDLYRPDPDFSRSKLERRFLALVKGARLPRPSLNFNFAEYELDVYWPEHRFAVELDVFETHGSRASFENDRRRQEELKLLGVEMIRITDRRLEREPAATIERVGILLERRRQELSPGPAP